MYTGVWNKVLIGPFLLIFLSGECFATGKTFDAQEGVYGSVKGEDGSPVVNAEVNLFDGFTLHAVKTDSEGGYKISKLPVSINSYAVIFFAKMGYIPQAANLRVQEEKDITYSTVMKKAGTRDAGFIIGTIYRPVRGGKLQFHSGIYSFGAKRQVRLERDNKIIKKDTDLKGHFLFEIPPGRYQLSGEGSREGVKIEVSEGQTMIQNLRSGIVLID